ncbi:MAG: FmdB family zinc ribbon protein [Desulfatiglandales bacterium]
MLEKRINFCSKIKEIHEVKHMPIYEFACTKCGRVSEVWQKITDSGPNKCEHCKGRMRKLISQSTFHLKGSGWYVTDYNSKRESDKKQAPTDKVETKAADEKPKKEAPSAAAKSTDE